MSRHFPALLVTGARQTGKTALLRHTFSKAGFVSLDLPSLAAQAEEDPDGLLAPHSGAIILDEVQYAPGLFRHLKDRIDRDRHATGRFLMTGSQKFPLMKALSESLAGRCAVLELDTLSASEVRHSIKGDPPTLEEFLFRGGFPELYRDRGIGTRDFYHAYAATYLERDVRSALRVGSLRDFERFLRACALRSGQLVNLTDLARDIGIAVTTARDWLSVLEASHQIALVEPYFGNHLKRMIKTPKLYFRDTGLLCFLLGLDGPSAIGATPFVGALWETFVYNQILRAITTAGSAARIFFWRDAQGTEVDFAIEHQGHVKLVEAKWAEEVPGRSFAPLEKVRAALGDRATDEHWIACRTPHSHALPGRPWARLINAYRFDGWLPSAQAERPHKPKQRG